MTIIMQTIKKNIPRYVTYCLIIGIKPSNHTCTSSKLALALEDLDHGLDLLQAFEQPPKLLVACRRRGMPTRASSVVARCSRIRK